MAIPENAFWVMRDERMYTLLEHKYADRQRLSQDAEDARRLADKSQTIDGKPNPLHPMLELKAEMAQMRFEMAYVVERNAHLASYLETLEYLHQRVGLCEGAYGHMKMLAETNRIDYALIKGIYDKVVNFIKEQANGKDDRETARPHGKGQVLPNSAS